MEGFGLNTAKSFINRMSICHLKDGSVIVNVRVSEIMKDELRRERILRLRSIWQQDHVEGATEERRMG